MTIFRHAITNIILMGASVFNTTFLQFPFQILQIWYPRFSYRFSQELGELWYRFMMFIFKVINSVEVRVSGDKLPDGESALVMMNHPSEIDWLFVWMVAMDQKTLRNLKIVLKQEIRLTPGIGWGCENLEYIYLTRDWDHDETHIKYKLNRYNSYGLKPWLIIFPEGTDIDQAKLERSWAFAEKNGYPKFNHVLLPRHKAVLACLETTKFDAVYDVTVGYDVPKPSIPSLVMAKDPNVVNFHIKRHPINQVPKKEEDLQKWLIDMYREKDGMMKHFKENGKFPFKYTVLDRHDFSLIMSGIIWIIVMLFTGYLFFTSSLVRWYCLIACIFYITSSVYAPLRILRGLNISIPKKKKSN